MQRLADRTKQVNEVVERWINTIRGTQSAPAAGNALLDTPDWWKEEGVDPEVERAIAGFRMSHRMLTDLDDEGVASGSAMPTNTMVLPLGVILDALPQRYRLVLDQEPERQLPVPVYLEDLYAQLARGRITIAVAQLVFAVPVELLSPMALRDMETQVTLPLPAVVAAIGPEGLAGQTVARVREWDLDALPELFTPGEAPATPASETMTSAPVPVPVAAVEPIAPAAEPVTVSPAVVVAEVLAPVELATAPPAPPAAPVAPVVAETPVPDAPVADSLPVEATPVAAPPVATRPPAPTFISAEALERLSGVDLNVADAAALRTLRGVTPRVAAAILDYRARVGRFHDIFELADVPGIGRTTFRKITGMAPSRTGRHRGAVLARCLGLSPAGLHGLPDLVRAIAELPGLRGCVISDREGLLLAEQGLDDTATTLSALVPRVFDHLRDDLEPLGPGGVARVSLRAGGRDLTVSAAGDLFLTAVQRSPRISAHSQRLLHRVAQELAWLLSHRGYVAPSAGDDEMRIDA